MIEFSQLEQLKCIGKCGTISLAAKELLISQPALSRSMQRLEEDLGVSLFVHYKNKIELNENGKLAIKYAGELIKKRDKMIDDIKLLDISHRYISIASCTPAPIWDIEPIIKEIYPDIKINSKVIDIKVLENELKNNTYSLIISPYPSNDKELVSYHYLDEDLFLSVPLDHPFKDKEEISYKEIDGITMLLYSNIGFWYDLHKKQLPNTRFLLQNERTTFTEIVNASSLPSFTSNLSIKREGKNNNRVIIPISDDGAHVSFYITINKKDKHKYIDLINKIKDYYDY